MNKWQVISNNLMDALILLDPPPFFTTPVTKTIHSADEGMKIQSSTSLSVHDVMRAYDLLLATSNEIIHDDNDDRIDFIGYCNDHNQKLKAVSNSNSDENQNKDLPMFTFHEKVSQVADLYRAIILSSSLLLEMCDDSCINNYNNSLNKEDKHSGSLSTTINPDTINLNQAQVKQLCHTIQQSILLLQRLSQIVYLATTNCVSISNSVTSDKTHRQKKIRQNEPILKKTILSMNSLTNNHTDTDYNYYERVYDWHDLLLPKSSYPLIQECFERKQLIDIETGVVFGHEDRLISLRMEDYKYCADSMESYHENNILETCDSSSDFYVQEEERIVQEKVVHNYCEIDQNMIISQPLSLNTQDIETEEMMLLDIAFPTIDSSGDNSKRIKQHNNRKRNYHQGPGQQNLQNDIIVSKQQLEVIPCRLPSTFIKTCEEKDILKYIQIPFTSMGETYPIIKEGFLILSNDTTDSTTFSTQNNMRCYVRLFNNGIIVVTENQLASKRNEITMYGLSSNTNKSSTFIHSNIFHFQIDDVILLDCENNHVKPSDCKCNNNDKKKKSRRSIVFAIDKEQGGNFLQQGCDWTASLDACIEVVKAVSYVCKSIHDNW